MNNYALPTLVEETSDDFSKSISMSLKDGDSNRPSPRTSHNSTHSNAVPSGIVTNGAAAAGHPQNFMRKHKLNRNSSSQSSFESINDGNGITATTGPANSAAMRPHFASASSADRQTGNPRQGARAHSDSLAQHQQAYSQQPTSVDQLRQSAAHSGYKSSSVGNLRQSAVSRLQGHKQRSVESLGSTTSSNGTAKTGSGGILSQDRTKGLFSNLRRSSSATSAFSSTLRSSSASSTSRPFSTSFSRGSSVFKNLKSRSAQEVEMRETPDKKRLFRGYKLGDYVLVRCGIRQVNMYGCPPGEGTSYAERHGPYEYAVAKVKQVHFEEISVYYTLTLEHNSADMRGDAELMERIASKEMEEIAIRAAKEFKEQNQRDQNNKDSTSDQNEDSGSKKFFDCLCYVLMWPFLCIYEILYYLIGQPVYFAGKAIFSSAQRQGRLMLNGMKPYEFSLRMTTVNLIVLCSSWYMFIDQARLAFFPIDSDDTLAHINFVIWLILVCELLFEVFIRPEGYSQLITSDKAFAPGTVRFISGLHLAFEIISLGFFVPEFLCIFNNSTCDSKEKFSFFNAALITIISPSWEKTLGGRAFFACLRLRVFGLVRHWKNMWINTRFVQRNLEMFDGKTQQAFMSDQSHDASTEVHGDYADEHTLKQREERNALMQKQRDHGLVNASNIGTALMVTNSYRALMIVCAVIGLFPMLTTIYLDGASNDATTKMVKQLQETNVLVTVEEDDGCRFLVESIESWVESFQARDQFLMSSNTHNFLFSLAIQPSRCVNAIANSTTLTDQYDVSPSKDCMKLLPSDRIKAETGSCMFISLPAVGSDLQQKANSLDLRIGAIESVQSGSLNAALTSRDNSTEDVVYAVSANFNQTYAIESSALLSFLLQMFLLILVLGGLTVLRSDAETLVLNPLRSMLRIVARYAKNPLTSADSYRRRGSAGTENSDSDVDDSLSGDGDNSEGLQFSNYETEQLISAVSKITDLLRKCWGVAGADIISTNLATRAGAFTEVFNPTVPGRSVYALFAFAAIEEFDHAQKCLGGHVMSLINDVAAVLHDEVFRWGFGDSGQCNKNLGGAFLMVFRIGLVKEVIQKLEEATNVVFSTAGNKKTSKRNRSKALDRSHHASLNGGRSSHNISGSFRPFGANKKTRRSTKNNAKNDTLTEAMQLSLQSLPGISTFTDRAVIGMLKSFAGIHRDEKLRQWSQDFRLSAGVGTYAVNMVFGMDAGWAVEGAVGSEYKIDATYLSPHVNMASRMMSACKHYGVTILLSEAVQELMSDVAKSKLRNLDRVTVKGSTRVQKIFTYDARHKGANFFLLSRQDEQADMEADRYVPSMWHMDQDLTAMRNHVTDDFINEYSVGLKAYYDGDWKLAIKKLEEANEIMVEDAMEGDDMDDGRNDEDEDIRSETADGPCLYLINFMKSKGGEAPEGWAGWHPLLSK